MMRGKSAIVTGASRGIGRAVALLFAREGASLVVNGTNPEKLEELRRDVAALGAECAVCVGDVADPDTAARAVHLAVERFGRIDVLVNNAGINDRTPTLELSREAWLRVLDVNLNGTFYMCREALPYMVAARGGSIVNITSTAAKTAKANAAVSYGASKAAVNAMTQKWALEFARDGIRVNAVCPGPVLTDMSAQWTDEYRANVASGIPLGRVGTPEEVAQTVLFLAGDGAGFITGETVNVNGGAYMN